MKPATPIQTANTEQPNRNYWSMTEGVWNCLTDKRRTMAFAHALQKAIRKGDVVVDAGTGSGILALIAAKAGASKVFAVENDPANARWLRRTFESNGFSKKIELLDGDATSIELPSKVDVIVCEMIATALIEELQIPAMRNLLRYARPDCRVVLKSIRNFVELVDSNNRFYGFLFPIPRYEYPTEPDLISRRLSHRRRFYEVDFSNPPITSVVAWNGQIKVLTSGEINGLRMTCESFFWQGSRFGSSFAYAYPLVLPIEPIKVKRGALIEVNLYYRLNEGFNTLRYECKPI